MSAMMSLVLKHVLMLRGQGLKLGISVDEARMELEEDKRVEIVGNLPSFFYFRAAGRRSRKLNHHIQRLD